MKFPIIILVLMMSVFPAVIQASEPYYDDSEPNSTSTNYSTDKEDDGYLTSDEATVFPTAKKTPSRTNYAKHLRGSEQLAIYIDSTGLQRNGSEERVEDSTWSTVQTSTSMESFSQVNPNQLFDRQRYLREHVQELMNDEKRFGFKARICRCFNVSWSALGGMSTASSMIVSAIGATEYMEPRLANLLGVVFGVVSGGCIWASSQSKKAAHEYHEERTKIKESLGVPQKLIEPEIKIDVAPFKGENEQSVPALRTAAGAH